MEAPQSHHVIIDLLHSTLGFGVGTTHSSTFGTVIWTFSHAHSSQQGEESCESNMTNCILDALKSCDFPHTFSTALRHSLGISYFSPKVPKVLSVLNTLLPWQPAHFTW